jgi:hypothetical protein
MHHSKVWVVHWFVYYILIYISLMHGYRTKFINAQQANEFILYPADGRNS